MPPTRTITAEVCEQAANLIEAGHSQRSAALQLDISQGGLSMALKRYNAGLLEEEPSSRISRDYEEIPVIHRDYKDYEELRVYSLGDVHKGSPAHDAAKWEEWIAYLAETENASMLGTGDYLNCALKDSVSEAYDEQGPLGEMKRSLWRDLIPIEGRIDLLMPGNHEARVYRAIGDCPIRDVADHLKAPYAKDAALVVYHVGDAEYQFYVRHGTGGGMVGARANRLQKQAQTILADVYVSGHSHSQLVFPDEIFQYDANTDSIQRRTRYYVSSGSFLRYEAYASRQSYAPTMVGVPRITLSGERHRIRVSI